MIIEENGFIHHVYFWLKDPGNRSDFDQLKGGLKKLSKVETIEAFHIGKPATTRRDVIESGYSMSWLLLFKNREDQDNYQVDPLHLKFVEECSHLWSKVVVYDTVTVEA